MAVGGGGTEGGVACPILSILDASPFRLFRSTAQGMRLPGGGGWRAANVVPSLEPYGHLGYLWHGSPSVLKAVVGTSMLVTGYGIYELVTD